MICELRNMITTTITNFSPTSGLQLKKQVKILINLLNKDQLIDLDGNVKCSNTGPAKPYVYLLIAETILKAGSVKESLDDNNEKVYIMGLAMSLLWAKCENFGVVFASILAKKCPQSIPYLPTEQEAGADQDIYFKNLGFEIDKKTKKLEDPDKHFDRIAGIFSIYCSVCQSPLPSSIKKHPHGMENLWKWLATTVNSKPERGYTAKLLFTLFDIAGYMLYKYYKNHFYLVLKIIVSKENGGYLEKIKQTKESEHNLLKLKDKVEAMIKSIEKDKEIDVPEKRKGTEYWSLGGSTKVEGDC